MLTGIRLGVLIAAMLATGAWFVALKRYPHWGWRSAVLLDLGLIGLFLIEALALGDDLMLALVLFGLVLGVCELVTDAWAVLATRTLIYLPASGPRLVQSPAWMPLGWTIAAAQFGGFALALHDGIGGPGLLLVGLLGAVSLPFYEQMAAETRLWIYVDCAKFREAPYYVILGEFLVALVIGACALGARGGSWAGWIGAGLLAGLGVLIASMLSYVVVEILPRRWAGLAGRRGAESPPSPH